MNSEPGTTVVKIDETASSDSQPLATRTAQFLVPKLPTQFQLSDLTRRDLKRTSATAIALSNPRCNPHAHEEKTIEVSGRNLRRPGEQSS